MSKSLFPIARGLRQWAARLRSTRTFGDPAQQRLQMQLRAVVAAAPLGMALTRRRRFQLANTEFCAVTGWSSGELIGRSPSEVYASVNEGDSLAAALRAAFVDGRGYRGELRFKRRDGSVYWGRLQARLVDASDPAAGTLWLLEDLGESGAEAQRQAWASGHDHLTRLLNRTAFEVRLGAWLAQAPAGQSAALLLVDLDGFKQVNDSVGPDAGDELLREVARVLQGQVRASDAVARLEGDAFALLLPGCVAAVAVQLGARLQTALAALAVENAGRRLAVAATVGVAELDATAGVPVAGWMARAHAAWYEAKYGGRGSVRVAAGVGELPLVVAA